MIFLKRLLYIEYIIIRYFLSLIAILFPFGRKRHDLETQHINLVGNYYDGVFHISSQGELEQIRVIINDFIAKKKKILILYTSPSVIKDMNVLQDESSGFVDISMMPLLKKYLYFGIPFTSPRCEYFFMVRYDFFPELLGMTRKKAKRSILVSAKYKKNNLFNFYYDWIYKQFDMIIATTASDRKLFLDAGIKNVFQYEFRLDQIAERVKTSKNLNDYPNLVNLLKEGGQKIIIGSSWLEELDIILSSSLKGPIEQGQLQLWIYPHLLKDEFVEKVKLKISRAFGENSYELIKNDQFIGKSPVKIIQIPRILCESYPYFKLAFVGGGFGQSVHSLLEPFVANCKVICGPRVHRSSEYQYILDKSSSSLKIINNSSDLKDILDWGFRDEVVEYGNNGDENSFSEIMKMVLSND